MTCNLEVGNRLLNMSYHGLRSIANDDAAKQFHHKHCMLACHCMIETAPSTRL
jgi:hypothetical protein